LATSPCTKEARASRSITAVNNNLQKKKNIVMVKHIVIKQQKKGVNRKEAVSIIASVLEPLEGKIPGLQKMEIRACFNGSDYALYSEFESRQHLADYAQHPLHLEAKTHFHHFIATRTAVDYEV
jgi:heme-degrading monooxygenase HmoA